MLLELSFAYDTDSEVLVRLTPDNALQVVGVNSTIAQPTRRAAGGFVNTCCEYANSIETPEQFR